MVPNIFAGFRRGNKQNNNKNKRGEKGKKQNAFLFETCPDMEIKND